MPGTSIRVTFPIATAVLLLCIAGILPLDAFGQARKARTGAYAIEGTVINSVTGEPIARVFVHAFTPGNPSTLTDARGHFEFINLPATQAAIVAQKPGFLALAPQVVRAEKGMPPLTLKMSPAGAISGTVEAGGEPVEGIPVKLLSRYTENGRPQFSTSGFALTDEDGLFRISNLPAGSYYLLGGPSSNDVSMVPNGELSLIGYSETFYPGVEEISAATPIELDAGQQIHVAFPIAESRVHQVSGSVTGVPAGSSVAFSLTDWAGNTIPASPTFDVRTGTFRLQVRAGSYNLLAFPDASPMFGERTLTVSSDLAGVQIDLAPLVSIPVSIRFDATKKTGSVDTSPTFKQWLNDPNGIPLGVMLSPTAPGRRPYMASPSGSDRERGLVVSEVQPGVYQVRVEPQPLWYVQSATSGGTDLLRDDLAILPGATPVPIEIVLRNDAASITGTIEADGRPVSGVAVLIPDRSSRPPAIVTAGLDGRFEMSSLPPGDYSVLAFDQEKQVELGDPALLSAYISRGRRVSLRPNERLNLSPPLIEEGK